MNKVKWFVILIVILSSCAYSQTQFEKMTVRVLLNKDYNLDINTGEIFPLDTINNNISYMIIFDKVRGGEAFLFGKVKIKETSNGYNVERLLFRKERAVINKVSINDITRGRTIFEDIILDEYI